MKIQEEQNILLYIENEFKTKTEIEIPSKIQELLTIATSYKMKISGKLYVIIHEEDLVLFQKLKNWPIDKVFVIEYFKTTENLVLLIEKIINKSNINTVIMGNDINEREIAPYLSSYLNWTLVPNIISFNIKKNKIIYKRFLYGTRAIEECEILRNNIVITFSKNIYKIEEKKESYDFSYEKISNNFNLILPYLIQKTEKKIERKNSLETSKIVIGVGKGIKNKENFKMVEELADLLGATIGVTRSVVDNGWRPEYEKIGQTGKIIKPELYLGFGISGAMQHMAGVQQSRHIVMVNNNPNAEVFKTCDLGIVADLFEIIPNLIKILKNKE